jgi:hypothetical protein
MDTALDKEVHEDGRAALATEPFISITTFRRDGTPVSAARQAATRTPPPNMQIASR